MNALKARRRYDAEQQDLAWKKRQEEEQAKIDAMTEDERATYLAEKGHRRRNAMQLLGVMSALSAGPYNTQATKDFMHLMCEASKDN